MKVNQLLTICGVAAALILSAGIVSAQDDNGGPPDAGGPPGGGGRGGGGFRNMDPAQMAEMQQRRMDRLQEELGFTNSTEWDVVKPLVQKVMDARRDVGFGGGMGRMMGNRNRGGNTGDQANTRHRGGMFGQQPSPEQEALQKAIDDNAPASQIKDLLAKCKKVQKDKQAKLEDAQADLKKVLTTKQEAQAFLLGLVN